MWRRTGGCKEANASRLTDQNGSERRDHAADPVVAHDAGGADLVDARTAVTGDGLGDGRLHAEHVATALQYSGCACSNCAQWHE